ncbi:TPA: sugar nucleotide-binding protein, partial [Campylobacter fetus]|nr:sugar nucleotide-binding protein [Campylobacter fetus]
MAGGGYNEIDENSPLYNPNIYGISKLIGEEMLRQSGIKRVLCLRLPTVLSVSDNGSFLFKWLNSAIHNR